MSGVLDALSRLNRDSLPHYTRILCQLFRQRISTMLSIASARWWGVQLGAGNTFVGRVDICRARGSSVTIGANGRFLSARGSNRHGLNRRCMITTLKPGAVIRVGDEAGFSGSVICAAERVEIGNRVMLGANTTVTDTNSHPVDYRKRYPHAYDEEACAVETEVDTAPVVIEDDVFIGMHTLVLKGVTIGRGSVVGAGSVVSKNLPPFCIAAGNPARPLKFLKGHEQHKTTGKSRVVAAGTKSTVSEQ